MYSDIEYVYYKVPVSNGTTLVEGTVPYTCEKGKGRLGKALKNDFHHIGG